MNNFFIYKSSLFFTFIYFAVSVGLMFFTYPHEDALIMFRYVENFADTGNISFNINGEKSEGATDFLWFLILSILNYIGINVNFAAILINTISLLFIINLINKFFLKNENLTYTIILFFIFLNIGPIVGSSLFGFSSIFFIYCGFACYLSSFNKKFISWTIFSIIFCLTRPEGVFLFLPTILIIFSKCNEDEKIFFYRSFIIISIVGLFYFIWRYFYFDNILPLPILVKSIGGETSISRMGALAIQILNTFLIVLIFSIIYSFIKNFKKIFKNLRNLYLFIGTIFIWAIYLFILSRGFLNQNIFDRYFASFYFIIFIIFIWCFIHLTNLEKKIILVLVVIASFDSSNLLTRTLTTNKVVLTNDTYKVFNVFFKDNRWADHPIIKIGKTLKDKKLKIMLTEAGALPYLSKESKIYDIVGLNTNIFAKRPVNCDDVKKISPDIIEIDVGNLNWMSDDSRRPEHLTRFEWTSLVKNRKYKDCGFHSKSQLFKEFLGTENLKLIKNYKKTKEDNHHNTTVKVAPNNILFCLFKNENYQEVFFNKKSDQIYFVKKDNDYNFLNKSCNIGKSGYFADLLEIKN